MQRRDRSKFLHLANHGRNDLGVLLSQFAIGYDKAVVDFRVIGDPLGPVIFGWRLWSPSF